MAQQNKPTVLKDPKPVWIKCRASEACDGNYAIPTMVFSKPITQGGGKTTRYRCQKCNGVFTITT